MKYFKIFLAVFILIILGIFVYLIKSFEGFDGGGTGDDNTILFNIRKLIDNASEGSCDIKNYRFPNLSTDSDNKDKVKYVMDSNFSYFPQILGFTMKYQSTLNELHSKMFLGAEKMENIDLMGCGETDETKDTFGIRVIGSDIFHNNIGKSKPEEVTTTQSGTTTQADTIVPDGKHRVALNLYEGTPIPLEKKKIIIIYPETITRLSNLYDELKTVSPITTMVGSTSMTQKIQLSYSDLTNNEDVDKQIYQFLYEKTFTDEEYVKLIYRALGVDESLITEEDFEIGKTSKKTDSFQFDDLIQNDGSYAGDTASGFGKYSDAIIKNNFRLVYYKDVLFSTDLAYWRTNIYNELYPSSGETTSATSQIPEHISKFTIYSNLTDDKKRLSFIDLLKKKTEYKRQLHILSNINKYGNLSIELISNKNKKVINENITYYTDLINQFIENDGSSRELINLEDFGDAVNSNDECNNCEDKMPKIDQNGNLIPPEGAETPEYITDIYPPYPTVSQKTCESFYGGGSSDDCTCNSYLLTYTYDEKTENVYILVNGDLSVDQYKSMYSSEEPDRFKLLISNISLFNPYTPVNAAEKFIEFTQLFHNIPTQMEYIKNL